MDWVKDWLGVIGGIGVVIIGLAKLTGSMMGERYKASLERGSQRQADALSHDRIQPDLYARDQYERSRQLLNELRGLKSIGDDLWSEVTQSNLEAFAESVDAIRESVNGWSLFFEPNDFNDLSALLNEFQYYGDGKFKLYELRDVGRGHQFAIPEADRQIAQNRASKERYENLLLRIEASFRSRFTYDRS